MNLQTQIRLSAEKNPLDYDSKVLLLGSCFTEHIGGKLDYFKFRSLTNPFGILFNPVSMFKLIHRALSDEFFTPADIFEKDGAWYCLEVHSLVFNSEKEDYIHQLNTLLVRLKNELMESSHIIFSFGTAWVHRFLKTNEIVANCHKIPQKEFSKELLSVEMVATCIEGMVAKVKKVNPKATFLCTVSPVRHIKEGLPENSLSKSHLIAGVHQVVASSEATYYFPSYEIMMDELRDYRFFEKDMIHPNETAIDIIWEKFRSVWLAPQTAPLLKEIDAIQKGLLHRPFNSEGNEHKTFLKNLDAKIQHLKEHLPHVSFS
ncbi:MAG: GSCFA domain-containing protein [Aureisphaera sp.]